MSEKIYYRICKYLLKSYTPELAFKYILEEKWQLLADYPN